MWFALVFKNLKKFIVNRPVLFCFIIISQIACIVTVLTVSGMIDAATPVPTEDRSEYNKSFHIYTADYDNYDDEMMCTKLYDIKTGELIYSGTDESEADKAIEKLGKKYNTSAESLVYSLQEELPGNYKELPKYKDVKNKLKNVLNSANGVLTYAVVSGYTDDTFRYSYSAYRANDDIMKEYFSFFGDNENDIQITKYEGLKDTFWDCSEGDKVKINNKEYIVSSVETVSQNESADTAYKMRISAMDDDFMVCSVSILADNASSKQKKQIYETIQKEFSDLTNDIEEPEPEPLLEKQFNNMIYVVSFIIMAVVLLNISRLYTYILSKRKKILMISSLCGGNRIQIFVMYISEVFVTLAVSYVIGFIIFKYLLSGLIAFLYPSFESFFTADIYLLVFGVYIVLGLLIMTLNIIPMIRKSVMDLKRS